MRTQPRDELHRVLLRTFEDKVNGLALVSRNLLEADETGRRRDAISWQQSVAEEMRMARTLGDVLMQSVLTPEQTAEAVAKLRAIRKTHRKVFNKLWAYDRRECPDHKSDWLDLSPVYWLDSTIHKL